MVGEMVGTTVGCVCVCVRGGAIVGDTVGLMVGEIRSTGGAAAPCELKAEPSVWIVGATCDPLICADAATRLGGLALLTALELVVPDVVTGLVPALCP